MNTSDVFVNDSFLVLDLDGWRVGYPVKKIKRIATTDIANIFLTIEVSEKIVAKVKDSEEFKQRMEKAKNDFGLQSACCLSLTEEDVYLTKLEDFFFFVSCGGIAHYFFIGKTSELIQKLLSQPQGNHHSKIPN
jgi:hypothetical protein